MSLTRVVLAAEIRQLLRDRRALFAAVVLPILLYPLLLGATRKMEDAAKESLGARQVTLFVDFGGAQEPTVSELRAALSGEHTLLEDCDATELFSVTDSFPPTHRANMRKRFEALTDGGRTAVVRAAEPEGREGPLVVEVVARRKDSLSREASSRAQGRLRRWNAETEGRLRMELLPDDPAASLELTETDVATAEDRGGANLGRFLPILLVFLLVSGGSYGALTVFAGERESRTLETLLTTPAPRRAIVRGKFLCVLAVAGASLLSNLAGLGLALGLGSASMPAELGLGRLAQTAVFLPALVLITAILCLVCGRARSFRQGQQLLFPLTLVLVVPTTIVLVPGLEHSLTLAVLPLSGAALSLRDALRGALEPGPTLAMIAAHLGWSALALRKLAGLLDAERTLLGGDVQAEAGQRRVASRLALVIGGGAVLLMLAVGTRLQAAAPLNGLLATLWGLMLPLALLGGWAVTRRLGPATGAASLRAHSSLADLLAAILAAPLLARAIESLVAFELEWLPLPSRIAAPDALQDLLAGDSLAMLLLVFAVSPGITEELLFRRTVLGALLRDGRPLRAIATSAGLFALAHLSLHRLAPTFAVGVLLGAVTWRTRAWLPAVLLHTTYNGWAVLSGMERLPAGLAQQATALQWAGAPALAWLLLRSAKQRRA